MKNKPENTNSTQKRKDDFITLDEGDSFKWIVESGRAEKSAKKPKESGYTALRDLIKE